MSANDLVVFLSGIHQDLSILTESAQKKNALLEQELQSENCHQLMKKIFKLISRIRKQCQLFEEKLIKKAAEEKIDVYVNENAILNESVIDDRCEDNSTRGCSISLKYGDSVRTEVFHSIKNNNIEKFWLDLKNFIVTYNDKSETINDQIDLQQLPSEPVESSRGSEEILEQKLKEIFGTDSEIDDHEPEGSEKKNQKDVDKHTENDNDIHVTEANEAETSGQDSLEQNEEREREANASPHELETESLERNEEQERECNGIPPELETASLKQCFEIILNENFSPGDPDDKVAEKDKSSSDSDGISSGFSIETIIKNIENSVEKESEEAIANDKQLESEKEETPQNEIEIEEIDDDLDVTKEEERSQKLDIEDVPKTQNLEDDIEETVKNSLEECIKKVIQNAFEICTISEKNEQTNNSSENLVNLSSATTIDIEISNNKETDENCVKNNEDVDNLEKNKVVAEENDVEIDIHHDSLENISSDETTDLEESTAKEKNSLPSDAQKIMNNEVVVDDDNPEKENFFVELGLRKRDNYDKSNMIRDELMSIFAEIECNSQEKSGKTEKDNDKKEEYDDDEVRQALEYLAESETYSDVESIGSLDTDDVFESDFSDSDESKSKFVPKKCFVKVVKEDLNELRTKIDKSSEKCADGADSSREETNRSNFTAKNCFVKLEVLKLLRVSSDSEMASSDSSESGSEDEDREIDRLCDLSTLTRKRRKSTERSDEDRDSETEAKLRDNEKRRRKKKKRATSSSETGSSTDDEFYERTGGIFDDDLNSYPETSLPMDPRELLTEIVCHTVHDSDSDSSSYLDSDDSGAEARKKKKKGGAKNDENKEKKKKDKDSWRNDPLLTGRLDLRDYDREKRNNAKRKLNTSSDSDSNGEKRKTNPKRYKRLDPNWRSDEDGESSPSSSSGDEFENVKWVKKSKYKLGDEGSDIEVVDITADSPLKTVVKAEDENSDKIMSVGRKNIKSVLSIEDLTQETQKAAEEEMERIIRLDKRNQMRSSSQVSLADEEHCLVLDTSSTGHKITVDPNLSKRMYEHQVAGVKFMWDACYESVDNLESFEGTGCILAHSMGLGKTFQVVSLVHTLFCHSITQTKHVLIVCPLSTVSGWSKEFNSAIRLAAKKPPISIVSIESRSYGFDGKFARVSKWKNRGGVLIVGYEAFMHLTIKRKNTVEGRALRNALMSPGPELVVLDEGHLLKNGKALRTKALMEIRTKRRIVLTGTPLQNNLTEYYYMVQFVKPNLLGTPYEFQRQFANPIMNGQYEDSDLADIQLMKRRTHVLHRLLKNTVQRYEASELKKYIKNIEDYALFVQLHPIQEQLYRQYISIASLRIDPKSKKKFRAFFSDFQLTKYICSHPQLLDTMEAQNKQVKKKQIKETDVISDEPEVQEVDGIPSDWWKQLCTDEVKTNLEFGSKLQVMMGIIEEAEKTEEKVLIFTSSLVELSSIEYFLKLKGTPNCPSWMPRRDYFRMDGTVPPDIRTRMCELFNDKANKKLRLFIMSHKVGGLGLNLVAANRVILLGANFNPSHDTQSIFRAYRFGQEKTVHIYRLLSMGTMEEKIYNRCVTKLAVASRVVDKHQIARHYKNLDLEDLYRVNVDLTLKRTTPAMPTDELLANVLLRFESIHKYHHHQKLLENLPDEDLNEEDKIKAWEEFKSIGANKPPPAAPSVSDITKARWQQLNPGVPMNDHLVQQTASNTQFPIMATPTASNTQSPIMATPTFKPGDHNVPKTISGHVDLTTSNTDHVTVQNNATNNPVIDGKPGVSQSSTNLKLSPNIIKPSKLTSVRQNMKAKKNLTNYLTFHNVNNGVRASNSNTNSNNNNTDNSRTGNNSLPGTISTNDYQAASNLVASMMAPSGVTKKSSAQPSNLNGKPRKSSSLIGPNPVGMAAARATMFRKTSSEDFQKTSKRQQQQPAASNKKKPLMIGSRGGSTSVNNNNNGKLKVQPERKSAKGGGASSVGGANNCQNDEDDDDDVVFVDEGKVNPEWDGMLKEIRDNLDDRGITLTSKKKKVFVIEDKTNETIIDLS